MADPTPIVISLTERGAGVAQRIADAIGAQIHGRARRVAADTTFDETTAHVRDLFAAGVPIVGICAAGILVRAVAPLLADKKAEPPVIAVSEDGSAVVPLLGGHRGANRLARRIAEVLGVKAAITTASDVSLGVALDDPPAGWRIAAGAELTSTITALVQGSPARVIGDAAFLSPLLAHPQVEHRPDGPPGAVTIETEAGSSVTYHQTRFALGVGCARDCSAAEMADLVMECLANQKIDPSAIAGVFSLDLKSDEAAVLDLAMSLAVPARFFTASELEAETPRLANPSDIVFVEVGCHGVAEAAAVAAAGQYAELIVEKRKSANATCAIARAPAPMTTLPGKVRGQVSLIGIGPGQAIWRTPEASRLIAKADELVGYSLYIDLLGPAAAGKPQSDFPLGAEEDRCRYALEQAAAGRNVALICSGDAGIYAMGALVYELMARRENGVSDKARRVEVVTAPGVSALQAAAARAGAPLGHDFCAISLSDLLTPRSDIERRVHAAATGDFVIAFYNPVSQRRREIFPWAIETLRGHRPDDVPVILASNLGRPEEAVRIVRLDQVTVDDVDMLTTVIVGSSNSQRVRVGGRDRVFTPRGYAVKFETQKRHAI
ncbi:MAG: precorrin-3B C(17)-methyltransferase [Pseudomonadota bacterium]